MRELDSDVESGETVAVARVVFMIVGAVVVGVIVGAGVVGEAVGGKLGLSVGGISVWL